MAEFWQQLIALIVTPALIVGAVAWLSRSFINQAFTRELERFKSELEYKNFEHRGKRPGNPLFLKMRFSASVFAG